MSSQGQDESRGPRRGARKRPDEYSDHPTSKRVRTWKANMSEEERDLNRAKNSLYQAIRRAKEKLKKQDNWINSDDEMKKRLEEKVAESCHQKA